MFDLFHDKIQTSGKNKATILNASSSHVSYEIILFGVIGDLGKGGTKVFNK